MLHSAFNVYMYNLKEFTVIIELLNEHKIDLLLNLKFDPQNIHLIIGPKDSIEFTESRALQLLDVVTRRRR